MVAPSDTNLRSMPSKRKVMTPSEKITQLIKEGKISNLVIGKDGEGIYIDFCRSEEDEPMIPPNPFLNLDQALQWVVDTYLEITEQSEE